MSHALVLIVLAGVMHSPMSQPPAARDPRSTQLAKLFPNVPVLDQDGRELHFYEDIVKDRIVVINFMYTSCQGTCPVTSAKLAKVQSDLGAHLGTDVWMVSISVDPTTDRPAQLKSYSERFKARPGWRFLTGTEEDIRKIRVALGFTSEEKMDHTGLILYGDEAAARWQGIPSISYAADISQAILQLVDARRLSLMVR